MSLIGPTGKDVLGVGFIDGSAVAAGNSGLLDVKSGATVTITDLVVQNANNTGISNEGTLTLKRVGVFKNHASALAGSAPFGAAGGIYNGGTPTVQDSRIERNSSGVGPGAAGIDNETNNSA